MRIISGELKSRKIQFPKTRLTRPMTDKAKETVFNIMGSLMPGKHILDLFAGSGSLGLEALSRGALNVTFVDQSPSSTVTIKKNLEQLGLTAKGEILSMEVSKAIDKLAKQNRGFGIIFIDPPYDKGLVKKTLLKLDQSGIVLPFAQVFVGHSKHEPLPDELQCIKHTRTIKIGQSCLSFLFRLESSHGETKSYISGEL